MSTRSAIVALVVLAMISGGLLAWRFGYVPEIGKFFAAEPTADIVLKNENIELVMSGSSGGAITSIKFKGLELVDVSDRGRLIQAAWQFGDHGECANPTQAGNISDGKGPSSSIVLSAVKNDSTTGTVTTQPAWWAPPGGGSPYCEWQNGWWGTNAFYPAIDPNGKLTAESTVTMQTTLAGRRVDISITPHMNLQEMKDTGGDRYYLLEAPAIYLEPVFSKLYRLQFSSNSLLYPGSQLWVGDPPIVCNGDDSMCLGWYSQDVLTGKWPLHPHNQVLGYEAVDHRVTYGIWIASVRIPATEAERTFRSHFFFGTKLEVQRGMINHRYATYHVGTPVVDPASPSGIVDGYTATATGNIPSNSIYGWAFDPDESGKSIAVHLYFDGAPGCADCLVVGTEANLARPDVNQAVGITGQHGFAYQVPERFRDGKPHTVKVFGIDSSGDANKNALIGEKTFTAVVPVSTLSPSPTPAPLPTASTAVRKAGDADRDGDVDIFDYDAVVSTFGRTGSNLSGDVDGNGRVDIFDYDAVVSNFGK